MKRKITLLGTGSVLVLVAVGAEYPGWMCVTVSTADSRRGIACSMSEGCYDRIAYCDGNQTESFNVKQYSYETCVMKPHTVYSCITDPQMTQNCLRKELYNLPNCNGYACMIPIKQPNCTTEVP